MKVLGIQIRVKCEQKHNPRPSNHGHVIGINSAAQYMSDMIVCERCHDKGSYLTEITLEELKEMLNESKPST